jgi:hypothetical protein
MAALKGLPVDRVPVFYWLNPHATCRLIADYQPADSGITDCLARRLWRRFERHGGPEAGEWTRMLPSLFEEYGNGQYALELGADVSIQSPELTSPSAFIKSIKRENGRITLSGPLGIKMGVAGIYAYPIESLVTSSRDLHTIEFPPITDRLFANARKFRADNPDICVAVEAFALQQVLCDYILGMEQYMLALYDYPEEIAAFMQRLTDWVAEIIRGAARAGADVVCLADDYGTTERPLISMKMWKTFTYPHLKRLIAVAHEAGIPFMLHSCGYQMPFLEYYVEAELDLLQSFQPKAGNDFEAAYEKYGDRLAFATGIDVQRGESMTPQELRDEILRYFRIGKTKGRYIIGTTHMLQYTMPTENVRAIFDTVREIQAGLHG